MRKSIFQAYEDCGGSLTLSDGQTQSVSCLFHDDSIPSMRLYADSDKAFCFSCNIVLNPIQLERKFKGEPIEGKIVKSSDVLFLVVEEEILAIRRELDINPIKLIPLYKTLDLMKMSKKIEDPMNLLMKVIKTVRKIGERNAKK